MTHAPPSPCPCLHVLTASQLQQAYVGMALAVASNRSFILPPVRGWKVWWKGMLAGQESGRWLHAPSSHRLNACKQGASSTPSLPSPPPRVQFKCFCDHIWYSVVRCRVVDAQGMPFPVPWCAAGAAPGRWARTWPQECSAFEGRHRARHALCLNVAYGSSCPHPAARKITCSTRTATPMMRGPCRPFTSGQPVSWQTSAHRQKSGRVLAFGLRMHWLIERERNLRTVLQPRSEACLSGAPGHAPDVVRSCLTLPPNFTSSCAGLCAHAAALSSPHLQRLRAARQGSRRQPGTGHSPQPHRFPAAAAAGAVSPVPRLAA